MLFLMRMVKLGAILPRNWLRRQTGVFSLPRLCSRTAPPPGGKKQGGPGSQVGGAHLTEAPSSTGHQPDTSQVLEAPW